MKKVYYTELTTSDFDESLNMKKKKSGLVLFCISNKSCNDFKPIYNEFAFKNGINFSGFVNVDENKDLLKYITTFPSIKLYFHGKMMGDYTGDIKHKRIINRLIMATTDIDALETEESEEDENEEIDESESQNEDESQNESEENEESDEDEDEDEDESD